MKSTNKFKAIFMAALIIFLAITIILNNTGCGGSSDSGGTSTPTPSPTPTATTSPSPTPSPTPSASPSPSPTPMMTYTFEWKKSDGISAPANLAKGSIIGANSNSATLFVYDDDGNFDRTINVSEKCYGVSTDTNGHLYACSGESAKYYKFGAPDWTTVSSFDITEKAYDIATEYQSDKVFLLSTGPGSSTYRMYICDSITGAQIANWSGTQYSFGYSLALSTDGKVLISFFGSDGIVVFDQSGNVLSEIQLRIPGGIFVDSNNYLYANYTVNSATREKGIAVYDLNDNNRLIGQHSCLYGTGDDQMWDPFGIMADSAGNIFVGDALDSKLIKFKKD